MLKRKAKKTLTAADFTIIETVRGDADVVVEFVPHIWLRPVENKPINIRETAKCFYPRRVENQTVDQYIKHLKRAKFECMKPKYTKQWELLDCRVLKMGIGSFMEAVNAEKFFSDFFNTTDAEAEMAAASSGIASVVAPKRLRKIKKPKQYVTDESESDDEGGKYVNKVAVIPCFNTSFKKPAANNHLTMTACTSTVVVESVVDTPPHEFHDTFDIRGTQLPTTSTDRRTENVEVNGTLTPESNASSDSRNVARIVDINQDIACGNVAGIVDINQDIACEESDQEVASEIAENVVFELVDQRNKNGSKNKCDCSCCQKLLNKVDYMQKKFFKELGRYRQEVMQVFRQFSDKYDLMMKSQEFDSSELSTQASNRAQMEEFEIQFKSQFPASSKLALLEINETIRTERDFKRLLTFKLKCIVKEEKTNETKLTRIILKSIGSSGCWSEFTWTGTDTKANFSELEALIQVITTVVECQFPTADAFKTLKSCVQQRTKSAAEFEAKKQLNNGAVSLEIENSDANTMIEPNGNNYLLDLPHMQVE